jgi:hypothetical protein
MNKLLIVILTLSILSCNTTADKYKLDQDSQNIYNLALDYITGSDTSVRYGLRIPAMPPVSKMDKIDNLENAQYLKWQGSFKSILDAAELFVVVNHKMNIPR